jgi:ornithine carbamoyltransferase
MSVRHVLSIAELGPDNLAEILERANAIATGKAAGERPLEGRVVGIYFRGTSTRTRTSFTVGALKLGAGTIHYGPNDLQLVTGETIGDTARVLSGYIDILVVRTNKSLAEMHAFAEQGRMAVVNAMSDNEHPTQAIADMVTIREEFGRYEGVHVLYLGEGNNTAASLALAMAMTPGMRLTLVTPEGYGVPADVLRVAQDFAARSGSAVEQRHHVEHLPNNVDAVYTTRWQTMGEPKAEADWQEKFTPFSVTARLMAEVSKPTGTVFLHDLPAVRGVDTHDEVLDGPQSRAFRQAEHKLTSAMATLSWCVANKS